MTTRQITHFNQCPHANGWYVTVTFWIFCRRIFVCSDCGDHHAVTRYSA